MNSCLLKRWVLILALLGGFLFYGKESVAVAEVSTEVWRLNCGEISGDYTDPLSGNIWMKDETFSSLYRWGSTGGNAAGSAEVVAGTDLQPVFQTNRWGSDMSYKIEVPNGTYKVTLMFAETYWNSAGTRVFDIALEGITTWHNVDIYAWSGGKNVAMELTEEITVSDQSLEISFPVVYMDQPCINGIEVEVLNVSDDAFLDFIQKKMFWYFWNEYNPENGMLRDKEENWFNPEPEDANIMSSTAINGLAMSIFTVGAERGWVTVQEAHARIEQMLNTYEGLQDSPDIQNKSFGGMWYHWIDMITGDRWAPWNSEISTVDSALFIMASLQAGEYFRDTYPDIAGKADNLYQNMDWDLFTNGGTFVSMGWKPEYGGYFLGASWNSYSESVFVDLIALGSPTYTIGVDAWTNMNRNWTWVHDPGHAFGYYWMHYPPLFTHQYHHLYYDLTDIKDDYADYFANSMIATLANRETCIRDWKYEENRWGLTASCGPDGLYYVYGGYPYNLEDGTIAPSAAITSIMFTPEESIKAARYMYFKYKHLIWGRYGFSDSFNVGLDWSCNYVDGLNHGVMILGIENYRSGLIKDTFMQSEYAATGLDRAGFVDSEEVSWSSCENQDLNGYKAFDGDLNTRWSSVHGTTAPHWVERDLKSSDTFNKITIYWETAYASAYKVMVSENRINWEVVFQTSNSDGGIDEITFETLNARYVRIYCLERATEWGYSIYEAQIEYIRNLWKKKHGKKH